MRRKPGFLADDGGFGFIDLMLAMVVLTIGVLALGNLQNVSSKGNTSSASRTVALNIAEKRLEEVRGKAYATIAAEAPALVDESGKPPQVGYIGQNFTREVTVATNSPITNTKTVTVIVTWSDKNGPHTVSLATILAL